MDSAFATAAYPGYTTDELRHLLRRRTFMRFTRFIALLFGLAALIILYLKSRT